MTTLQKTAPAPDALRARVREFLIENFLMGDAASMVGDADPLMEGGVLDSTGVLELVDFLQRGLGVSVGDGDMLRENLNSVEAIVAFARGRGGHAP